MKSSRYFTYILLVIFFMPFLTKAALVGLPTSPSQKNGVSSGLMGYWTFDGKDVVNGRVNDISGNGNHANTSNIATSTFYIPGKIGQGTNFNGSSNSANASVNLSGTTKITLSFWMKWNAYANDDDLAFEYTNNFNSKNGFIIDPNTSSPANTFSVVISGTSGGTYNGGTFTRPSAGVWHHYVITMDRTTGTGMGVKTYVDGVNVNMTQVYSNTILEPNFDNSSLYFMSRGNSSLFGTGSLDDVRIYNRILSASEATQLYNMGQSKVAVAKPSANSGLIGYWTFDGKDILNGRLNDVSGNGNNLNPLNISTTTFYGGGKIGQGLNFDGVNDYIQLPNAISNGFPTSGSTNTHSLSFSVWFKTSSGGGVILAQDDGTLPPSLPSGYVPAIYIGTDKKIYASMFWHNSVIQIASTNTYGDNKWHHLVDTYGGGSEKLYIDGILVGSQTVTQTAFGSTYGYFLGTGITRTGGGWANLPQDVWSYFNGTLDDVRFYNRTVSASEVRQLYSLGQSKVAVSKPTNNSGLVGYWTFDGKDTPNGRINDLSGSGNHANTISISTSTFYAPGKIGQGVNLDGINDAMATISNLNLSGTNKVTISMWMNKDSFNNGDSVLLEHSANSNTNGGFNINPDSGSPASGFFQVNMNEGSPGFLNNCVYFTRPSVGRWHHYVFVMDKSQSTALAQHTVYVDGISQSLTTCPTYGNILSANFPNQPLYIGARGGTTIPAKAVIDDLRIYNKALSPAEAIQLYNQGR